MPLQLDVPPLQPLAAHATPTPLYELLQGRGKPRPISSTVRAYVPLIYALILRQGVPLCQPSADPAPLPRILD